MAELIKTGTFNYQINQLVDENSYIVLHPETNADVVIESATRIFMKPEERQALANIPGLIAERLVFKGNYSTASEYKINDVVAYNDQLYICIENTTGDFTASKWFKVNQVADRALSADKALDADKLGGKTEAQLEVAKAAEADQAANAAKLGGKVEAELKVAEATVASEYRIDANTTKNIKDKFSEVEESIRDIIGGGTVTSQALTINVEGKDSVSFDGSVAQTVEIKQNYAVADIAGLIKEGKIDAALLPDSIVGQLEYMGTWSAAIDGYKPAKGQYYIAAADVNVNPDGSEGSYNTGDWAVYNGTAWDKIDNTDAVTLVNGQKGAVETYKGDYVASNKYYKGDIVKNDGKLYIANKENQDAEFVAANWELFGRSYEGDGVVIVEGDNISHKKAEVAETTAEAKELAYKESFTIATPSFDEYGHVKGIESKTYTLPEAVVDTNTVREIKVNGESKLGVNELDKAIDFANGAGTTVEYTDGVIKVNHAEAKEVATDAKELAYEGTFTADTVERDEYGHVTKVTTTTYTLPKQYELPADLLDECVKDDAKMYSGKAQDGSDLEATFNKEANRFELADSGINAGAGEEPVVYSAVSVNNKGIAVAGGQIIEFGKTVGADPTNNLVVGGLFFRKLN